MRTIVLAFGRDANGELGRGEAAEDPPERGPTAAAGRDEPADASWQELDVASGDALLADTRVVRGLLGMEVSRVACGLYSSLAIADGVLYMWGSAGIRSAPERRGPQPVSALRMRRASVASAAGGRTHILASTECGLAFAWGRGQHAQLGDAAVRRGGKEGQLGEPRPLRSLSEAGIAHVVAGEHFGAALSRDGEVRALPRNGTQTHP